MNSETKRYYILGVKKESRFENQVVDSNNYVYCFNRNAGVFKHVGIRKTSDDSFYNYFYIRFNKYDKNSEAYVIVEETDLGLCDVVTGKLILKNDDMKESSIVWFIQPCACVDSKFVADFLMTFSDEMLESYSLGIDKIIDDMILYKYFVTNGNSLERRLEKVDKEDADARSYINSFQKTRKPTIQN